jgi:hypothetical protein
MGKLQRYKGIQWLRVPEDHKSSRRSLSELPRHDFQSPDSCPDNRLCTGATTAKKVEGLFAELKNQIGCAAPIWYAARNGLWIGRSTN